MQNFIFCIDIRLNNIIDNLNGIYTSCGGTLGIFFDNNDN